MGGEIGEGVTNGRFRILDPGRQVQTALLLSSEVDTRLDQLAALLPPRSLNKLVVAVLSEHAPRSLEDAAELMADHYAARRGSPPRKRNLRLPGQVRGRFAELADELRERAPAASRSLLASAVLDLHLPADAAEAVELIDAYETTLNWSQLQALTTARG